MPPEEENVAVLEDEETAIVMENLASTTCELQKRIVELTKQLTEVEGLKKSADKGFNDQIKDIKAEIKLTLDLIKHAEENANES